MKILFLEAVQNYGGARRSTVELAERLDKLDNQIMIVDFWGSCIPFVSACKEKKINLKIIEKKRDPQLLSNSKLVLKWINYIFFINSWFRYRKKINQIIEDFEPNFIIVNNLKTLSILDKNNKHKIIYFARGWFQPSSINIFKKFIIKYKTDIYIGVSEATRHAIFLGGYAKMEDIYVVPNAFKLEEKIIENFDFFSSWDVDNSNRPITILHCGGFLKSKGQELIIEIAKILKEKKINFKVNIVGIVYKGSESEYFFERIKKLVFDYDLEKHVNLVVNSNDVISYFSKCDILIHPTTTEGLPRVVMEAMAFGKPVIGNPAGGMTDFIQNNYNGILTNFNNIDDYIEAIIELYENKKFYKFLSQNASSLILEKYTVENQVSSLNKIFSKYDFKKL
jgi:glycosyltransferase involved in cell wall biosynthesis